MNRAQRKLTLRARSEDSEPELLTLSEEDLRDALEFMERSSESRLENALSPDLIANFITATRSFRAENGLTVVLTSSAEEIPRIPDDVCFKYSRPHSEGDLPVCTQRIKNGEKIAISLVFEEGLLIGYGIAAIRGADTEIEIIDVDCYSRREADLKKTVELDGQLFHVGVGHVIVDTLLQTCPKPVKVNATSSHSRYIFKSLGFRDAGLGNPCVLKMT